MKKEFISELFKKFEDACYDFDGVECWSARELQDILGYSQWRNFKNVIDKAQKACKEEETKNHFAEFSKMVEMTKNPLLPQPKKILSASIKMRLCNEYLI